jgi:hypothetical protein
MDVNFADLLTTLNWMWQGMFLLFACCGFIALVTVVINKIVKPKK